ncbi:MAG: hypothetical protein EMLJLAPB_01261 [Candidatus Argoarchaeum ethanivorans]|uniref:Periplasmic copper-binding protein NosD beta helix domain-containing protein n=1 Tax=Candidatus Argoarchaeum ethanivorans TaxID=2608793 RepID=A0A811THF2_9EURY|nr:MAG: hypothetical protein EMLJLAPB_01261 [Candidatus Argoarchaeum ethanivorans]
MNFIDEFKEQIEASLGKTFSEALRDSVYYKSKGVTELNVTPAVVVQGETVSITGKALPNEPVWLKFSFAISLPVSEGNYSRDFTGIHLPTGNKSLFLTVENVKDIQIIFEAGGDTIEYYSNVTGGIFTIFIPETDIPPGKCNITVCGNATDDATSVNLTTDMSIKVIADSNGDFSLNISTEGVPIGEYQITAGAIERTVLVVSALVHNLNTGENFSTIQAAVDAVNTTDGHTITVAPITYNENVNVYKSLTIKSTSGNPDDAMVQALDSNDHVFEVTADYVNLLGFTATGATGDEKAGIYLYSVKHCIISDNNASNNYYGIRVAGSSSYCEIDNNIVLNNLNAGISVK